jgi:hypothetical protein
MTELLARETERRGIAVYARAELVVEIALDGVRASTRCPGRRRASLRACEAVAAGQAG